MVALVSSAEVRLAERGVARAVIVLPDAATPVEKSAAAELADGLKRVTGASFAVVAESQAPSGTRLYVGATKASKSLRPNRGWKMDEVLVDNVADGVVLDGHPERAPIYAVDCYLERELGVRWWTSKAAAYPKNASPVAKVKRYSHASPFKFRETYFLDAFDPDFKVRSKINYTSVCRYEFDRNRSIPKEKGGDYTLYFFKGRSSAYHSAFEVLPPSKYFEKHPEWYSFVRGKRQPKQLCCTNREMLDEYIRMTKELLRASPDCNFIQCSQNDDWDPCWCEKCSAVKESEGGAHGANNLRMANAVAEAIEDEFPNVWVDTFAYQYTRKAPKLTKPRRNLLVRLCSVECGFNRPISDPSFELNAKFANDLEEWSKIGAGHLFIWDYAVDFSSYMLPHPTILNFVDNIRMFAKSGAVGLFEQGDATCSAGEFAPLRFYLLSKLAWDPSLDEGALIDEFLAGYYGAKSAPLLRKYLVHMHMAAKAGPPMTLFHEKISTWIGPEAFLKGAALMDAAYAAAQTEGVAFAERVRREKMSVDHAFIVEWDVWKKWADEHKVGWPRPATRRAAVEEWISSCRELGVRSYRETNDPRLLETYFARLRNEE